MTLSRAFDLTLREHIGWDLGIGDVVVYKGKKCKVVGCFENGEHVKIEVDGSVKKVPTAGLKLAESRKVREGQFRDNERLHRAINSHIQENFPEVYNAHSAADFDRFTMKAIMNINRDIRDHFNC